MDELITTRGAFAREELGLVLPHEHVFTDLGPMAEGNWRRADPASVVDAVGPEIERAKDAGVTALVECTPEGVGRRVDVLEAISAATELPIVVPTGVYQEPRIPEWVREASEDDLAEWMRAELTDGADGTGVRAAFIKVSTDDDDPDRIADSEAKVLRAAARAGASTGAAIGSHTLSGDLVHRQLDVIEDAGYTPERFVWIHAQAEPDRDRHVEVADRGAYVEYDAIGDGDDDRHLDLIETAIEEGYAGNLLLSQDRGWYDPSKAGGGTIRPYTYLPETFLPKLEDRGIGGERVRELTHDNPFDAFAR